ncbi:hypothetical protein [Litorivivens sp.]|uniref:hypothetical protein n=1 Tax=Litorivivens sp. TaxID=2020868 RepID=UPI0035643D67
MTDFVDIIGTAFAAASLYAFRLSRKGDIREHSTKMGAVLLIAALALFSDHPSVYFAALIIVATTVTEVEFLQNLAAIARGNSDYFKYKIEELGRNEQEEKAARDQRELGEAQPAREKNLTADKIAKSKRHIENVMAAESAALDRMEDYFGAKIKRNVRVRSGRREIELDGLIPSIVDDVMSEKIIEVKYLSSPRTFGNFAAVFPKIEHLAREYTAIAKKIAKLHIVVVVEGDKSLSNVDMNRLKAMIDRSDISAGYSVFTTKDLGIEMLT